MVRAVCVRVRHIAPISVSVSVENLPRQSLRHLTLEPGMLAEPILEMQYLAAL